MITDCATEATVAEKPAHRGSPAPVSQLRGPQQQDPAPPLEPVPPTGALATPTGRRPAAPITRAAAPPLQLESRAMPMRIYRIQPSALSALRISRRHPRPGTSWDSAGVTLVESRRSTNAYPGRAADWQHAGTTCHALTLRPSFRTMPLPLAPGRVTKMRARCH
jgi:hypothetical protein